MEKLNMQTANIANENFKKLLELFPNAVTETINENGELVRAIDKDVLMQEINTSVVEGREERYQFTWPDKRKAIIAANAPTTNTLRPCREESVNFDTTQNLYIEGDNLEVLKLLQENYLGQIKMIYIDPPYNTGNDFIYEDDFAENTAEYLANSGQFDEIGNRLTPNTETNGRFHTDWLNMIYPRLKIARNLLTNDGAIFISIGDDEEANLIKICDEIFGEQNFIASICHKHRASVSNDRIISENHNHLVFYAKDVNTLYAKQKNIGDDPILTGFNREDEHGKYKLTPVDGPGGAKKGNPHYEFMGVEGYWRYSKETMQQKYNAGLIVVTDNNLQQKYYESQAKKTRRTVTTWWDNDFLTSSATSDLQKLMGGKTFDNPKNVNLILRAIKMITNDDEEATILDFFSGSGTTAQAVMQMNVTNGGHRKFILVQLNEPTPVESEARAWGYQNIPQIAKERIRRCAKKIKDENPNADFDGGFRVLKLDTSNMQQVYYNPETVVTKNLWEVTIDNIKEDRTSEDLLFQAMLELNVPLSATITKESFEGKELFNIEGGYILACFEENLNDEIITNIAKRKPYYFVMRDSSLKDDSVAINFEQLFKSYSPETLLKVF